METTFFANLAVWYVIFLFSTTLHEASHAYAAARGGDYTAYNAGQVTLNPLPHIRREKFGMVIMPLLSFFLNQGNWMIGWASAPYNPYWAARRPWRAFVMSLAGPLSHILPAGVAWFGMYLGLRSGFFAPGFEFAQLVAARDGNGVGAALALFLGILFQLNLILLVFNLLPVPPLDGSEIWNLFIRTEGGRLRWRAAMSSYSIAGLLAAWWLFPKVYPRVWRFLVACLYEAGLA